MTENRPTTTDAVRVAAIYDVHGNLPALEAVLRDVRAAEVDRVVVGGDVLPGPMPREALELLLSFELPMDFIYGNGERAVLSSLAGVESTTLPEGVRAAIRWTGEQLSTEQQQRVRDWPATVRINVAGLGATLFCHATPRDDNEIFTRTTPAAALVPIFEPVDATTVVCGHTHMQFDRMIGGTRVVNAGSVGMPFGCTGANWAILGPSVELRWTDYDLETAAAAIQDTSYPGAAALAKKNVLSTPSEEEMLAVFERVAIQGTP